MFKTLVVVGGVVAAVFAWGYCKFPPTSGESMAGWVQAFGSVVAIGLAVWLQHHAGGERQRQAAQVAKAFAQQLLNTLDMLQLAARKNDWPDFNTGQQMLIDTLGMQVPLSELSGDHLAMVLTLRGIGHRAYNAAQSQKNTDTWRDVDNAVGNLCHDCREIMKKAGLKPHDKAHSP